jgi:SOS-response transcriptional repressor LexA
VSAVLPGQAVGPLTVRQREILRVIVRYREVVGEPPSERYLARRLGLHLTTIQGHLAALYRRGWLASPSPGGVRCLHSP